MTSDHDIARWRLRSQHLVTPHAGSATEALATLALRYFTGHGTRHRARPRLLGDVRDRLASFEHAQLVAQMRRTLGRGVVLRRLPGPRARDRPQRVVLTGA